jgi:hypothetical protein
MQFTLDPKPAAFVEAWRRLRGCSFSAGTATKRTIPGGIMRTSDPGESWAFQRRVMSVSHSLARQERKSQPKPRAER